METEEDALFAGYQVCAPAGSIETARFHLQCVVFVLLKCVLAFGDHDPFW